MVYGIVLRWPGEGVLEVGSPVPGPDTQVTLLGYKEETLSFDFDQKESKMIINLPHLDNTGLKWAWVLKFVHLQNGGNAIH